MMIHLFPILFIWFVNQEISAISYKKYYVGDYSESNSSVIKLGANSDSVISLGCSHHKGSSNSDVNGTVVMSAIDSSGIVISIHSIKLETSCDIGVSIKFESEDKMSKICDLDYDPNIMTSGMLFKGVNVTVVYTSKRSIHTYCDFTVTAYTNGSCQRDSDFKCLNGICIWNKLLCDHRNNCGDSSDESYSLCREKAGIAFLPLFLAIPVIVLSLMILFCCFVRHQRLQPRYDPTEVVYIYDGGFRWVPTVGGQVVTQQPPDVQNLNAGYSGNQNDRFPDQNEPSTSKQGTEEEDNNETKTSKQGTEEENNNETKTSSQDTKEDSAKDSKDRNKS